MPSQLGTDYYRTPEEYLAAELESKEKHEYLAGVVYAMAGASLRHNLITGDIYSSLLQALRGKPCRVFSSDLKVRIRKEAAEFYYYPDVTVDCSSSPDTAYYAEEPRVIFEVSSPETERIDRGEKWNNYQSLASLAAYVLVDQRQMAVTVYRRMANGWATEFLSGSEPTIDLPEINCQLPLAVIYGRTDLVR